MTDHYRSGPDVAPAVEDVRDRQERRITEDYAEQAIAETLRLARRAARRWIRRVSTVRGCPSGRPNRPGVEPSSALSRKVGRCRRSL